MIKFSTISAKNVTPGMMTSSGVIVIGVHFIGKTCVEIVFLDAMCNVFVVDPRDGPGIFRVMK